MDKVLARVREACWGETRERLSAVASAVARLRTDPSDAESRRVARRNLHRVGTQTGALGLRRAAAAARAADDALSTALLLSRTPDRATLDIVASLARDAVTGGMDGAAEAAVLVAPAGPPRWPSGTDRPDPARCEVVGSVAELVEVLDRRPVPLVILDLSGPIRTLAAAARATRAWHSATDATPPVIAVGRDRGVLDRHVLNESGVAAFVPAEVTVVELARTVHKLLREREGSRGTVFLLGADAGVGEAFEKDLLAEDVKVYSFPTLDAMLRRFVERSPDLLAIAFAGGAPEPLRAIRDLRDDPEAGRLPIVAIVDRVDANTRLALTEAGADEWIAVPWLATELASRVVSPIDLRRLAARRLLAEMAPRPDPALGPAATHVMADSSAPVASQPVATPGPVPGPSPRPVTSATQEPAPVSIPAATAAAPEHAAPPPTAAPSTPEPAPAPHSVVPEAATMPSKDISAEPAATAAPEAAHVPAEAIAVEPAGGGTPKAPPAPEEATVPRSAPGPEPTVIDWPPPAPGRESRVAGPATPASPEAVPPRPADTSPGIPAPYVEQVPGAETRGTAAAPGPASRAPEPVAAPASPEAPATSHDRGPARASEQAPAQAPLPGSLDASTRLLEWDDDDVPGPGTLGKR